MALMEVEFRRARDIHSATIIFSRNALSAVKDGHAADSHPTHVNNSSIGWPTPASPNCAFHAVDEVDVVEAKLGTSLDLEAEVVGLECPTATIKEHGGTCLDNQILGHVQDGPASHQPECTALCQLLRQVTCNAWSIFVCTFSYSHLRAKPNLCRTMDDVSLANISDRRCMAAGVHVGATARE